MHECITEGGIIALIATIAILLIRSFLSKFVIGSRPNSMKMGHNWVMTAGLPLNPPERGT